MFPNIAKAPVTMLIASLSTKPNLKNNDVKKHISGDKYMVPVERMFVPV